MAGKIPRHVEIMRLESGKAEYTIARMRTVMLALFVLIDLGLVLLGKARTGFAVPVLCPVVDGVYLAVALALMVLLKAKGRRVGPPSTYGIVLLDFLFVSTYISLYRGSGMGPTELAGMAACVNMLLVALCGLRFDYHATLFATLVGTTVTLLAGFYFAVPAGATGAMASMVVVIGGISSYLSYRHRVIVNHIVARSNFERFLPPQVVDQVLNGSREIELGGSEMRVSVLFSDICGFTPLCETMRPLEIMTLLNDYFSAVAAVIFKHGGTLDKFIGDAVMAVFGAPVNQADDAARAVRCALEMREVIARINQERAARNEKAIRFGIGIHTGVVVAGNVGSPERMEYTVLGDTVNVAARVEGLTRKLDTDILITGVTRDAIGDTVPTFARGEVTVKGRAEPLVVYGV